LRDGTLEELGAARGCTLAASHGSQPMILVQYLL